MLSENSLQYIWIVVILKKSFFEAGGVASGLQL